MLGCRGSGKPSIRLVSIESTLDSVGEWRCCKFCGLQQVGYFDSKHPCFPQLPLKLEHLCLWTSAQKSYQSGPIGPTVCSSMRITLNEFSSCTYSHFRAEIPHILTLSWDFHDLASHVQVQPYFYYYRLSLGRNVRPSMSNKTSLRGLSSNHLRFPRRRSKRQVAVHFFWHIWTILNIYS